MTGKAICSIPDCPEIVHGWGWCPKHYQRWRFRGDPLTVGNNRDLTVDQRFELKVQVVPSGCHQWTGTSVFGYGQFKGVGKKMLRAHRWAWERLNGPVPEGFELDHLCRNRGCVNPAHLEVVTRAINQQRAWDANPRTHCRKGHELTAENTYTYPNGSPGCRTCRRNNRTYVKVADR